MKLADCFPFPGNRHDCFSGVKGLILSAKQDETIREQVRCLLSKQLPKFFARLTSQAGKLAKDYTQVIGKHFLKNQNRLINIQESSLPHRLLKYW